MLNFSDTASRKVKEFLTADPDAQGKNLRVFVKAGGCSGFEYGIAFDEKRDDDEVIEYDGFQVLVDPQSSLYVQDAEIDYHESIQESGFSITNRKAKSTCGCGTSFEV